MNDWQILRQAEKIIRALTWTGGALYFAPSNVCITPLVIENFLQVSRKTAPFCTIRLVSTTPDPLHPNTGETYIKVTIGTSVQGDDTGALSLMGTNSPGVTSKNKGVLSFEPGFLAAMNKRSESGGIKFMLVGKSYGDLQYVSESDNIAFREYDFMVYSTSAKTYQAPLRWRVTGAANSASGSWTLPTQFGLSKVTVKYGSTTIVDTLTTTFSNAIAPGTYIFTIQAFYIDKSDDSSQESIILSKNITVTA